MTERRIVLGWAFGLFCALASSGLLAGCGWAPLYADPETGPADDELRAVRVVAIPERIGQRLELALRNSLNPEGIPTPQRLSPAHDPDHGALRPRRSVDRDRHARQARRHRNVYPV